MNAGAGVWLRQENGSSVLDRAGQAVAFTVLKVESHPTGVLCELAADDLFVHILYAGWHPAGRLTRI
ncbi:hypothetical protein ABT236_22590 [Streptomyces sp. NPDC001523]|uniref:hypothetical protein n=1 Tax=Streptomyces sp. NPDC001523 TaxID=3154383 RepID=UPI00331B4AA4